MTTVTEALSGGTPAPSPTPTPSPAPTPAPSPTGDGGTPAPMPTPAPSGESWRDKFLTDAELRGSEHLSRYQSIDDLAKAHIQTVTWARGRVAIPKADDAEGFAEFVAKVRPEKAEDYVIAGPDGKPSETGEMFRPIFHEAGLHPQQAKVLTDKWNQLQADLASRQVQAGKDELTAIELELGPSAYNQRLAATENLLKSVGIDIPNVANALEQVAGAGATMRALFALAEKTGELAKVDGVSTSIRGGAMTAEQAKAELDRQNSSTDKAFIAKLGDKSTPEYAQRQQLIEIVAKASAGA
ncbi:hypothetical protein S2M10_29380 [Sphingomonas sp. S2M10]|uniref:hypothetical protein n=1 Tax=Sphingomonas sp. S2M10 TaxID=2705010 RepID=UPI001456C567|nr:hypothetical protein [Sphingomonas sp. S2M10]NLS27936.1 hypothetical protein [Sphingomonas sp. S2M10]